MWLRSLRAKTPRLRSLSCPLQTASEECKSLRGQLEVRGKQLRAAKEAVDKLEVGLAGSASLGALGPGLAPGTDVVASTRSFPLSECGPIRGEGIWFGSHWTIERLPIGLPIPKLKGSSVHFCRHPEFVSWSLPLPGHLAGAARCVFHAASGKEIVVL